MQSLSSTDSFCFTLMLLKGSAISYRSKALSLAGKNGLRKALYQALALGHRRLMASLGRLLGHTNGLSQDFQNSSVKKQTGL